MKNKANSYTAAGASNPIVPRRRGRRADGVLDMRAHTSARNAQTKKIVLMGHAATSQALRNGVLDLRSRSGKAYRATVVALTNHLGNDLSAPQRALIDQAARLRLLTQFAWAELYRSKPFRKNGDLVPAFDAYRRAAADERAVLTMLGIERHVKEVPTIQDYVKGHTDGKSTGNTTDAS